MCHLLMQNVCSFFLYLKKRFKIILSLTFLVIAMPNSIEASSSADTKEKADTTSAGNPKSGWWPSWASKSTIAYPITITEEVRKTIENAMKTLTQIADQITKGSTNYHEIIGVQTDLTSIIEKLDKSIEKLDQNKSGSKDADQKESKENKERAETKASAEIKSDHESQNSIQQNLGDEILLQRRSEHAHDKIPTQEVSDSANTVNSLQTISISSSNLSLTASHTDHYSLFETIIDNLVKDLNSLAKKCKNIFKNEDNSLKIPELKGTKLLNQLSSFVAKIVSKSLEINNLKNNNDPQKEIEILLNIKNLLHGLKKNCDEVVIAFRDSSLSGFYGSAEKNINMLGNVLNSVCSNLSVGLSHQFKAQMFELVGFPALVAMHKEITQDIGDINLHVLQPGALSSKLERWQSDIRKITTIIKTDYGVNDTEAEKLKTVFHKDLDKVIAKITEIKKEMHESPEFFDKKYTIVVLMQIQIQLNMIISTNGGFLAVMEYNLKTLQRILEDFNKGLGANITQANNIVDVTLPRSAKKITKHGYTYGKRFALFAGSIALGVSSILYMMKNSENKQAIKAGSAVLGLSCMYPIYDAIRTWLQRK